MLGIANTTDRLKDKCVGSCTYKVQELLDLFRDLSFDDYCSAVNDCKLPLPPKKYDFGERIFQFPGTFKLDETAKLFLKQSNHVNAKLKFSEKGLEIGCVEATVAYTVDCCPHCCMG